MKIAICLSGEPRDFHYIWNDLWSKLNCPNADIYIHTWHSDKKVSELPASKERGGEAYQLLLEQTTSADYIYVTKPVSFLIENYYYSTPYKRFSEYTLSSIITRMYSMFYGIQSSLNLVDKQNYDYIVRIRPDMYLEKNLDWDFIQQSLTDNPMAVLMPDLWLNIGAYPTPWSNETDYWPDFFWIYKSNNNSFRTIYDDISKYCGIHIDTQSNIIGDWPSIPEHYLSRYLKSKDCEAIKMDLKVMIARQHRQITSGKPIF